MYQALLTRRYLTTKVMPLLASLAVLLCTATVLVTWSVMGGFLSTLIASGRTMVGDVIIAWPGAGLPYYEELITDLKEDPDVAGAAPMLEAYGIAVMPNKKQQQVIIRGVDARFADVSQYRDILWWKPVAKPVPRDKQREDPRLRPDYARFMQRLYDNGLSLSVPDAQGRAQPAIVLGIEVSGMNYRDDAGFYEAGTTVERNPDGSAGRNSTFLPGGGSVVLNVLPMDRSGGFTGSIARRFPVANEFQSGIYELDHNIVFLRADALQDMLGMNEGRRIDPDAPPPASPTEPPGTIADPARVTHVLVRGKADLSTLGSTGPLKQRVEEIYAAFAARHPKEVPAPGDIDILTWEDLNATMISAVQNETTLVLFLFGIFSLTAVFLVLAIFWSMVVEKTRDVGILRSLGASRAGVAWLWLRYGLAIGLVGSTLGVVAAYLIVLNINEIHTWLGHTFHVQIWNPKVYYFLRIPSRVEPAHALEVFIVFLVSSVAGALIPALRAAYMRPVEALRFE